MEILLNELSLTGQFRDENDFFDNLDSILKNINFIDKMNFLLLKKSDFFDSQITSSLKLMDLLKLKTDRSRKFKSSLLKLSQTPPFWDIEVKHNCEENSYIFNKNNVCMTSLAEACERDRVVLSFSHKEYNEDTITIYKDTECINLFNLINQTIFLDYLFKNSLIEPLKYCKYKFKNSKLSFEDINDGFNFDSLETEQQVKEFIEAFILFDKATWDDILKSDGFKYKSYSPNKKNNWFKDTESENKNIFKFRVNKKYRCFGYRDKDIFYVLRFEVDHKISDNG